MDCLPCSARSQLVLNSLVCSLFAAARGYIYHVAKDNLFEDGYFYYRFKVGITLCLRRIARSVFPHYSLLLDRVPVVGLRAVLTCVYRNADLAPVRQLRREC